MLSAIERYAIICARRHAAATPLILRCHTLAAEFRLMLLHYDDAADAARCYAATRSCAAISLPPSAADAAKDFRYISPALMSRRLLLRLRCCRHAMSPCRATKD